MASYEITRNMKIEKGMTVAEASMRATAIAMQAMTQDMFHGKPIGYASQPIFGTSVWKLPIELRAKVEGDSVVVTLIVKSKGAAKHGGKHVPGSR